MQTKAILQTGLFQCSRQSAFCVVKTKTNNNIQKNKINGKRLLLRQCNLCMLENHSSLFVASSRAAPFFPPADIETFLTDMIQGISQGIVGYFPRPIHVLCQQNPSWPHCATTSMCTRPYRKTSFTSDIPTCTLFTSNFHAWTKFAMLMIKWLIFK